MAKARDKIICFVVSIVKDSKTYYLESEDFSLDQPVGIFSESLFTAKKWTDRELAKIACSAYEGARVEVIKTGEVLK